MKETSGGLVVEPEANDEKTRFVGQLDRTLKEAELELKNLSGKTSQGKESAAWEEARRLITKFQPVPWFIWRLSNFVLGKPGTVNRVSEGFVLGLRRLLFAAASDRILGAGEKVNNVRQALEILPSDVVAAMSVIHGVCRRLGTWEHERIWGPMVDDAILRASIGYFVGRSCESFGPGRGMLAGFSGRCGLAIMIACGDLEKARQALEMLAAGDEISEVGLKIYGCSPLQVSAMLLSACGCGRDAACGTVGYASADPLGVVTNEEQLKWLAAFSVTELVRMNQSDKIDRQYWQILELDSEDKQEALLAYTTRATRQGHGWNWLV